MEYDGLRLGRVIRKVRTERGLTQDELSEGTCWTGSAISRFERNNTTSYSQVKIDQLLERLGIMEEQILYLVDEVKKEELIINYLFRSAETQIKQGTLKGKQLKEKLEMINHPTAVRYLRGKYHFHQGIKKYDSAKKCYLSVVENVEDETYPESNIIPSAFLDLSFIAHEETNYSLALEYIEHGLSLFDPQGSKQNVYYGLYYNKALFLVKLGHIEEADKALELPWTQREKIHDILTRIKVYQVKSSILRHQRQLKEAFRVLSEAFDIANSNPLLADGQYYILTELGKTTFELGKHEYAERCLIAALDLEKLLIKSRPTEAYIMMGRIYLNRDDTKKAKEYAKSGIKSANTKITDGHKLIQAHILLGNIFEKESNKNDACSNYRDAMKLANEYDFGQYKPELHDHLYRCNNN